MPTLNQEEIYQLLYHEKWNEITVLLHKYKTEIASEAILKFAAKTFETVFLQKLKMYPKGDKDIKDILERIYLLHHGKFYLLQPENIKQVTFGLITRSTGRAAFDYATDYPDDPESKLIIENFEKENLDSLILSPEIWIEIFNRLFEAINNQADAATYFTGPRFIKVVKEFLPYHPDYSQYIELRNKQGKSTSRKIFFYDIFQTLNASERVKVIKRIFGILKPHLPEKVDSIESLLGNRPMNNTVAPITLLSVETSGEKSPAVFISYSWDDVGHKKWVFNLANRLSKDGVKIILDQYYLRPGRNLQHFVENNLGLADRVIIIFTPNYKLKADNRTAGVGFEYSIINIELYNNQTGNEKIIPVLRSGTMAESIPTFMQQFIHLDLRNDDNFENSYGDLIREIFDEPFIKVPVVGSKPEFGSNKQEID